jgi:hypothetical protein
MKIALRSLTGLAAFALVGLGCVAPAKAQTSISALVTATCGTPGITLTAGRQGVVTQNTGGQLCVNATVSASVAGFSSNGSFGSLTATATTSASTALPSGTVTRITNTSSTATVSCTEATGAATGVVNNIIVEPGSSVSRVNGAFDHIACIDQTGSTGSNLVILEGGAGLGNDSGGGGGGGGSGGGTVTQGPTGTNAAAWWVQIGDTTNGPVAVATAGADAVSNTQNGLAGYARNEVYNGTTWDRLRSGTTTGSALINGAGTAGTASGGILTVQGVASMTPLASNVTQVLGSAIGATNGLFTNILQGNAALTAAAALPVTISQNNTALGSPAAYGTTPTGNALSVNAFVTNTNGNGQATMANSSPVVIASNQSAIPVTLTSTTVTGTVAAVGPTAVGSANANPPVVIGGTATGAAGQNVQGLSIVAPSVAPITATNTAVVVDLRPDSPGIITLGPATVANSVPQTISSQYPTNATTTTPTAVTATATGTTAATAASLGATASVTNYVCGFDISADATSLTTGTATLSGTISGSLSYIQTVQAVASGATILTRTFNPCIPASAANTAITITSAAAGTLGNTIVNIWGYRL